MARRPEPIRLAGAIVSVMRGPDDTGRWYWRARRRGANNRTTLWTGWGTREEVAASLEGREMSEQDTMYTMLVNHVMERGGDLSKMMRLSGYNRTPASDPVSPRRWVEILRAFPTLTWEDLRTAELRMKEGKTASEALWIAQTEKGRTKMRRLDEVKLGTLVRDARMSMGWTQGELAREAACPAVCAAWISHIECLKPQHLTNERIAALERALGLPEWHLPRLPDGKAWKVSGAQETAAEVTAPQTVPPEVSPEAVNPEPPETAPTITMTINIGGTVFKIEGPLAGMAGFLAQYQKRVSG